MSNSDGHRRFRTVYEQKTWFTSIRIIEDAETGVQYLSTVEGHAGGLTVLVDKEGLPVVAPRPE